MLQIIGVGLVGLCTVWGAAEGIMLLRRRAKNISDLEHGVSLLRQELELAPVSMEQMMFQMENVCEGEAKKLFFEFRKKLCELEYRSACVLWKESVEGLDNIPTEIRNILASVGNVLGRYDMNEQVESLRLAEQRLGQVRQQEWEKLRQQEKLFWALSTSAGGFLIILLI